MNRQIERILFGLMTLILIIALTNDTFRIKWQGWGVHLDIMAADNIIPLSPEPPHPHSPAPRLGTEPKPGL